MKIYFVIILFALTLCSGCSSRQMYDSAYGWRQHECSKILDPDQRRQCYETAEMSHPDYERQRSDPTP